MDLDVELLTILRDNLGLTGTKYGCGEGACGACMVLINGNPSPSSITPVNSVVSKEVTTIEGFEIDGKLHAVQEAVYAVVGVFFSPTTRTTVEPEIKKTYHLGISRSSLDGSFGNFACGSR